MGTGGETPAVLRVAGLRRGCAAVLFVCWRSLRAASDVEFIYFPGFVFLRVYCARVPWVD